MTEPERIIAEDKKAKRSYTTGEEIANSITHGIGVVFGVVAMTLAIVTAVLHGGDGWRMAAAIIYGSSLIVEYTFSTLYHSFPWPNVKHTFKILDHAGIYFLIAGSYTPFMLVTLRQSRLAFYVFIGIWTFAFVGIAAEAFWVYRPKWLSAVVYIIMGWIAVLVIKPLVAAAPPQAVWLLVAGGLSYTLGTLTYIPRRVPYLHSIWHIFVLAGSVLHFLAVVLYVL
jgi:hemolysin III